MSRTSVIAWTLGACLVGLAGCSEQEAAAPQSAVPAAPAPAPADRMAAAQPPADPHAGLNMRGAGGGGAMSHQGRVLQAIQSQPYTYLEVESGGAKVWIAAGQVQVAPGDVIRWGDQAVMRNFTSKSLGRTFPEILFVASVQPVAATAVPVAQQGRVQSVASAAGYSYIQVETPGGGKWLAAPETPVKVGDTISWSGGNTMRNFTSNSLNQTFPEIDFVASVSVQR